MTAHLYTADANERQNAIQNLGFTDEGIACYVFTSPAPGPAPLYRAYHPTTGAHFYTMSIAERDNATNHLGYSAEGIACYIWGPPGTGSLPLYRAYRGASDDHFYTTNAAEMQNAVQHLGYSNEGIVGYVVGAVAGAAPLFRMFKGTHFYTADANEQQNAIQNLGFTDEGIACYVFTSPAPGPAPLYRAYHSTTGAHFYTMSIAERDNATNHLGYSAEGIACYIDGQAAPNTTPLYRGYQPSNDDHFYTTNAAEMQNAVQHLGYSAEGIAGSVLSVNEPGTTPLYRMYGPSIARHLPLTEQHQEQTEWCWAATTVSITKFLDSSSTWTQCELVNKAFGQTTCCTDGSSTACNKGWYADKALSITGHLGTVSSGAAALSTVVDEINANHPISIAIYWTGGGGHNPAISGYDKSNASAPKIDLQDPWYGASTQDFNSFPSSYQGGATWGTTYKTK
jgi:hypothetical protein